MSGDKSLLMVAKAPQEAVGTTEVHAVSPNKISLLKFGLILNTLR